MPTPEKGLAVSIEQARARVSAAAFGPRAGETEVGRVGLEPEIFPIRVDADGQPAGRVGLWSAGGTLEILDRVASREAWICARKPEAGSLVYALRTGGRITFEPGGQVEHSTAVHETATGALEEVEGVVSRLRRVYAAQGAVLATAGLDVWHPLSDAPQQLTETRYPAMARYFEARGSPGQVMMRHTASTQVNLDLGPAGAAAERWLLANLVSPLATATFASSPTPEAVSARAQVWQELDPTRSGFPRSLVEGRGSDPAEMYTEAALDADVMLFQSGSGSAEPGEPGWNFRRWVVEGHPRYGWPTLRDLDYHLTTLFFEVRPRGFLELRTPDALPDPWRPVPVVLLTGLLYDPKARSGALSLLGGLRARLDDLWRRGARKGLRDSEIGSVAPRVWEIALEGARRLPRGFLRRTDLDLTERYLERYTLRGRSPAEELREALALGKPQALRWAVGREERPDAAVAGAAHTL